MGIGACGGERRAGKQARKANPNRPSGGAARDAGGAGRQVRGASGGGGGPHLRGGVDDRVNLLGLEHVFDEVRGEQVALDELVVPVVVDLPANRARHAAVSRGRGTRTPAASCLLWQLRLGGATPTVRATSRSSTRGSAVLIG